MENQILRHETFLRASAAAQYRRHEAYLEALAMGNKMPTNLFSTSSRAGTAGSITRTSSDAKKMRNDKSAFMDQAAASTRMIPLTPSTAFGAMGW